VNEKTYRYPLARAIEILMYKLREYEAKILDRTVLATLSGRQLHYLKEIYRCGNPTVTELSERMSVSKPSVSVIIDKLIKKGIVKKIQSAEDKRTFFLSLTKSGKQCAIFHESIHARFAAKVRKLLNDKEITQLTMLFDKIIEKLP
jgi:DNA-binding MarR family transcriptional regulator